jgi:hypothetical protein
MQLYNILDQFFHRRDAGTSSESAGTKMNSTWSAEGWGRAGLETHKVQVVLQI